MGWEPPFLQCDINDVPLILDKTKYDSSLIQPRTEALQELVMCKLTRDAKITLAERILKITTKRFSDSESSSSLSSSSSQKVKVVLRGDLESGDNMYNVLENEFGVKVNGKLCLPSLEKLKKSKLLTHL